jgi:hypothetical protein
VGSQFGNLFAERGLTGLAAPALDVPLAGVSESFTGGMLASCAGHGLFSACVGREKPYNEIGSGVRLAPRSGFAPDSVSAKAGARNLRGSCLWRFDCEFQHELNSDSHRDLLSTALLPQGGSHFIPNSLSSDRRTAASGTLFAGKLVHERLRSIFGEDGNYPVALLEPSQRVVDRGTGLRILREVESHILHALSNFIGRERAVAVLKYVQNHFGKSETLPSRLFQCGQKLVALFSREHRRKTAQSLSQLTNTPVGRLAFDYACAQFVERFPDNLFKIRCHNEVIVHVH